MGNLLKELQTSMGLAMQEIHRVGGFQVDYTLVTDTTKDPMTIANGAAVLLSGIFIQPTTKVRVKELLGGRWRESLSAAAVLSAEALPVFIISREALKVSGTFRIPTHHDSFVETGTTSPIFRIQQITGVSAVEPGFIISASTIFRSFASG